jgi:hypothetical protein
MSAPNRRQFFTGAAAYAAGAAIVAGGAALANEAHGAAPAVNSALASVITAAERAQQAFQHHADNVLAPAWERFCVARDEVPHTEVRGVCNNDGGPTEWSTSQTNRVADARRDVRTKRRFAGAGANHARAFHQAQRRLLAAAIWRDRKVAQAMKATGYDAAFDKSDRLDLLADEAATRVYEYPFTSAVELRAALDFAEERGAGHAVLLPLLTAGVRRLAGEVRA